MNKKLQRLMTLLLVLAIGLGMASVAMAHPGFPVVSGANIARFYVQDTVATENPDGTYSVTVELVGQADPTLYNGLGNMGAFLLEVPNTKWMTDTAGADASYSPGLNVIGITKYADAQESATKAASTVDGQTNDTIFIRTVLMPMADFDATGRASSKLQLTGFTKEQVGMAPDGTSFHLGYTLSNNNPSFSFFDINTGF